MTKRRIVFAAFLSLALLASSCSGAGGQSTPTPVPTPVTIQKPTYQVQRGTVTDTVELMGRVTPVQQQDLFFRSDGLVQEVLVTIGEPVSKGQVLVRLGEPENYQADVAAAELAYGQAQLKVEQVELEIPIETAKAEIALKQAKKDLEKAQTNLKALSHTYRLIDDLLREKYRTQFVITEKAYRKAQYHYNEVANRSRTNPARAAALDELIAARHAYYLAAMNLDWMEEKIPPEEIEQAQINASLAQGIYDKVEAEVKRWQADNPIGELALAKLALADSEARLAQARKALENVEIRAPFDGQVLSLGVTEGSSVKSFQAVLTLANPRQLEIRAVPTTENLSLLAMGQVAVVHLSSQQGKEFAAKIMDLPLTLSTTSNTGAQDPSVHIKLVDQNVSLTLGEAATVVIEVGKRENVLWLPPAALRTFQGRDFVLLQQNNVQRRVDVYLGLRSNDQVEILSGLTEGQTVVGP